MTYRTVVLSVVKYGIKALIRIESHSLNENADGSSALFCRRNILPYPDLNWVRKRSPIILRGIFCDAFLNVIQGLTSPGLRCCRMVLQNPYR